MTSFYLLAALDLTRNVDGAIVAAPPDQAIYRDVFARTFTISFGVTVLCLILGFPVAYLLATLPARPVEPAADPRAAAVLDFAAGAHRAWVVLLQREGVVNNSLRWLGIVDEPLALIFNRFGVYRGDDPRAAAVHDPAAVRVMKAISPAYMRAAASLGARRHRLPARLPAADRCPASPRAA